MKVTLTTSAKAEITLPNVVRDLLMFAPSCEHTKQTLVTKGQITDLHMTKRFLTFSLVPLAPVESARSLPAKSTRLILLTWRGMKDSFTSTSLEEHKNMTRTFKTS